MLKYLVVSVLVGCGSVTPRPSADGGAGEDAGASDDAAVPRCASNTPFGTPHEVQALNTEPSDENAYFSDDEQTVWFSRLATGASDYDIYQAAVSAGSFTDIAPLAGVNTTDESARGASVSTDGLHLYTSVGGGSAFKMKTASRATANGAFSALQSIPGLSEASTTTHERSPYSVPQPAGSHDIVLYYASDANGTLAIYRSKSAGAEFSEPKQMVIQGVAAGVGVTSPVVTPDERTLYFTMTDDIYVSTRLTTSDEFGSPTKLALSSDGIDSSSWISRTNCVLYFSRQNPTGPLAYKIYSATRDPVATGP